MNKKTPVTKTHGTLSGKSQKKDLKNSNQSKKSKSKSELNDKVSVRKITKRVSSKVQNEISEIDFSKSFFLTDLPTSAEVGNQETYSTKILKELKNSRARRVETLGDEEYARESGKTAGDKHLVLFIIAIFTIAILGFWAPQISRVVGIPIDPAAFTAEYFQNPEIVKTGIVSGDLLNVRIENGFRKKRTISWKAINASRILDSGTLEIPPFSTFSISIKTTGALPGEQIEVYVDHVSKPLTVSVN